MEKKVKDTIIVITLGFLVIFLIANRGNLENTTKNWLLFIAMGVSFIGFAIPYMARLIHIIWFWIGDKLGFVVSKVVLGVIFLFLVIPFGLIARMFRKDLMFMKGSKTSTFLERHHIFTGNDFENPW